MIRNIVFDMGNVLLRYNPMLPCLRHAADRAEAEYIYQAVFCSPDWILTDMGMRTDAEFLQQVQQGLPTQALKDLAARVMEDWDLDGLWPKDGMEAVIQDLLDKGWPLYILSNASTRFRKYQYKIPFQERFNGILVSAEEKMIKPDAKIYLRLCEKFGLKPEECLFIDDLQANIDGAQAVGMTGYCYADGDVSRLKAYLDTLQA